MDRETIRADPASPTAPSAAAHRPDVQGLRAVAVLMVLCFHAGLPVPGGFVGVDVFFVISGFVITTMLSREWAATGRINFPQFYLRRFLRLTPALAVMASVTVFASSLFLSPVGPQQVAVETSVGALFLVANFVIAARTGGYFDDAAELNPLLHTWSLSVEEQFYLVFPLVLASGWAAASRFPKARYGLSFLVGSIGLTSLLLGVLPTFGVAVPGLNGALGFYSPLTRAWEFCAGAGLALLIRRLPQPSGRSSNVFGPAGALLMGSSLWIITEASTFPGVAALLPVTGTLLVLYAGGRPDSFVSRSLSSPPLTRIGDWSYSLYLWHWPFVVIASQLWPGRTLVAVLAVCACWLPAVASYRWVEQPLRSPHHVKGMHVSRRLRVIVPITFLAPVLVAGAAGAAAMNGFGSRQVQTFQASKTPHPAGSCVARDDNFCRWNTVAPGPPVYLVGDSHAGHFGTGVLGAATSLDRPMAISMAYNCPFTRELQVGLLNQKSTCFEHNESVFEALMTERAGTVIIAGADTYWAGESWAVTEPGGLPSVVPADKVRYWERALVRTVTALRRTGHDVILVQTVPLHERYQPERCSTLDIHNGDCSDVLPESEAEDIHGEARAALTRVAEATDSRLVDPWNFFCRDGFCSTSRDSAPLYTNWSHISVHASGALTGLFKSALDSTT
ncbi:acyltransferase family protein [Knoellia sp. CPCC 206435]|uniref:acyltransferase family protein n=1 Tax=Knoellia terrae TaxID=3404797 RepID=UPI003B42A0BA